MRDYLIYDELISFRKPTVFDRALKDMVLAGNAEAKALWRLGYIARDNLFRHAQRSKQRTPFIDELVARALILRMGVGDGQAIE